VQSTLSQLIYTIDRLLRVKDPYTLSHQVRVAWLARRIALVLELPKDEVDAIYLAGLVHDVGKICVPDDVLQKPGPLAQAERDVVRLHVEVGYQLLRRIKSPVPLANIAHQHHERLNGSGYPQGLFGESILPEARIIAVADVAAAMCTDRPYRRALSPEAITQELLTNSGKLYDPVAVEGLLSAYTQNNNPLARRGGGR